MDNQPKRKKGKSFYSKRGVHKFLSLAKDSSHYYADKRDTSVNRNVHNNTD
jgi:hypothetical protein